MGCRRISATVPAICRSCSGSSVIAVGAPDEGPDKVAARGTVVDEVEAGLVAGSDELSPRVGLRLDMSTLGAFDVPGAPDPE